jgi:hypothetical protein
MAIPGEDIIESRLNRSRSIRTDIGASLLPVAVVSFVAFIWQVDHYFFIRPATPNKALGLIYALSNHGSYVYISAVESTGHVLLGYTAFAAFLLGVAITPRTFKPLPEGSANWHSFVHWSYEDDLKHPSTRAKTIMALSAFTYSTLLWCCGSSIAGFVVAEGLVL